VRRGGDVDGGNAEPCDIGERETGLAQRLGQPLEGQPELAADVAAVGTAPCRRGQDPGPYSVALVLQAATGGRVFHPNSAWPGLPTSDWPSTSTRAATPLASATFHRRHELCRG
jgi:hypothetical protein